MVKRLLSVGRSLEVSASLVRLRVKEGSSLERSGLLKETFLSGRHWTILDLRSSLPRKSTDLRLLL